MKLGNIDRKYQFSTEITIDAPLDTVWRVLADFDNVYKWAPSVVHSTGLNEKSQQAGAGRHCEIKGFGNIEEVITQWQENQGFQFTISDIGPLTQAISNWYVTENSKGSSKVTVEFGYQLKYGIVGKTMHLLIMRSRLKQGLSTTLSALKHHVENHTESSLESANSNTNLLNAS